MNHYKSIIYMYIEAFRITATRPVYTDTWVQLSKWAITMIAIKMIFSKKFRVELVEDTCLWCVNWGAGDCYQHGYCELVNDE